MKRIVSGIMFTLLLIGMLTLEFDIQLGKASGTIYIRSDNSFGPPIDWVHYHNYSEIVTILLALNETYPDVVDVFSIGKSWWNRDIYCVRLTNESDQKPKPEALFIGYHHAREPISAELTLYFVVYATTNFGLNQTITELINNCEIYVVVAVNVDAFDLFEVNDMQRKNARPIDEDEDGLVDEDPYEDEDGDGFIEQLVDYSDPERPEIIRWEGIDNDGDHRNGEDWVGGVDLNRNYDFAWEDELVDPRVTDPRYEVYRGPEPFSEPETQAIRDLVLAHNFMFGVDFHSGCEMILYPWGNTSDPAPDEAKFKEIAQDLSNITGGTEYKQSSGLYPTQGCCDDWLYETGGVFAFTIEIFINDTFTHLEPGPYPNTTWEGGWRCWFNPFPKSVESVVLRWLPVFFYLTNRTINEATHNVAVTNIEPWKNTVGQGLITRINLTVENQGLVSETFNVTAYANTSIIQTLTNISLTSGSSTTISFEWNTTDFAKGNYSIKAYTWPVQGETETTNNNLTNGWIKVVIPGDLEGDGDVDLYDAVILNVAYGSKPGDLLWNPNADIVEDNKVDLYDAVVLNVNYGKKWNNP